MVSPAIPMSAHILLLGLVLAGCDKANTIKLFEPVIVKEAVPVKAAPPAELMEPYRTTALPNFVRLTQPKEMFCVDPFGAANIKALTHDLKKRDEAWREWATTPLPVKP